MKLPKTETVRIAPLMCNSGTWGICNSWGLAVKSQGYIDAIAASIKRIGQQEAILIAGGHVIHGRMRLLAMQKLRRKTIKAIDILKMIEREEK